MSAQRPSEPLCVLHVVAPARVGGLETVVRSLTAGLRERGHDARVAAVLSADEAAHPWCEQLRTSGVPVDEIRVSGRAYLRERAAVRSLCARHGARILHTHGYRPDVIDAGVGRRLGIPRVTTVHGRIGGDWRNRLYERLQLAAFRSMDAVVAVSRPLAEELSRDGVRSSRLRVLPNAYAADRPLLEREAASAELNLPLLHGSPPRIGWVGRLSAEKGLDVLLDALALVGDHGPTLSVVGTGRDERVLRERAERLGIAGRVTWHGNVPDAGRLLGAFDLFVLSSRTEGTPMVLLEAMAAGVPIVAAAVGGVPDVVTEEEAYLVPPDNIAALAAAVRTALAERSDAAARVVAATNRLTATFAVEPWLAGYERLYRTLLAAPVGGAGGVPR